MARPLTFEQAKARYVHRFTLEHVPAWASVPAPCGRFYAPQYRTDREWYEATAFPGECDISPRARYCHSAGRTWPWGQWLDAPFVRSNPERGGA